MATFRSPEFLGRADEREMLDGLLDRARRGEGASLVIRGEAGVGKTALLHYCARQASGFRVIGISGIETEMELPFAGLHQICSPMLPAIDALPEPQQVALRVAFGLSSGEAPDRFLIGVAALGLLAEAARERPLLCLVDDAQWLDATSAQVLGLAARRLRAESVGVVFAVRDPMDEPELANLPVLPLAGLEDEHAKSLLATVIPGRLDERVRDRIIAETGGNPLALIELPRGLPAAQVAGGFGLPDLLPLSGRIEESFVRRLEEIPHDTRLLLLVAAADPVGDPALVWRAAAALRIATTALDAAVEAGLLVVGAQVRFRHPLVRSAVYRSALPHTRRAVHVALAEATDAEIDPDRRAWHLAAAAPGPDEDVASELERSADRAQARGGVAAAAAFLRRSVALTHDPARRVHRALAAAQASLHAGAFDSARALLAAAEAVVVDELDLVRVDLLRGQIAATSGPGGDAPAQLLAAARRLEPFDVGLARETYLDAWGAALFAGGMAPSGATLVDVSRAARLAAPAVDDPQASDLLLDGLTLLVTEGRAVAAPALRRAVTAFRREHVFAEKGLQWGVLASLAAVELWDFDSWNVIITSRMDVARGVGALAPLSIAIQAAGTAVAWSGDFAAAARLNAEADAVTEATRTRIAPYGPMLLAALRGREPEARALIDGSIKNAVAGGDGLAVQYAHWVTALLNNSLARYEEAFSAAKRAIEDMPELCTSVWALAELIEAATRTGRAQVAADAVERLAESAAASGTDWGLGIAARAHALVGDGAAAEDAYREAIERLSATRLRPELARAHLLYGEWLRRGQRRIDARAQLSAAHEMFSAMGAEGFAERARHELLATGARVRSRISETRDDLTAQEEHIAERARAGRTNAQIAAELYLSPRTVEWHLNKVFTKLGISSRRGLDDALPSAAREPSAV